MRQVDSPLCRNIFCVGTSRDTRLKPNSCLRYCSPPPLMREVRRIGRMSKSTICGSSVAPELDFVVLPEISQHAHCTSCINCP